MKEFQPTERLDDLHTALEKCSKIEEKSDGKDKVFTLGERIAINQERGSIFSQMAFKKREITALELRTYKVSQSIENKINFILNKTNP